jgi:hypothetical protein
VDGKNSSMPYEWVKATTFSLNFGSRPLEAADAMRLQAVRFPDALHRA